MAAMQIKRPKLALLIVGLAVLGGFVLAVLGVRGVKGDLPDGDGEPVALVTSLPIYWPDGVDFADLAQTQVASPWTRQALERDYTLQPLDSLTPLAEARQPLPGLEMPEGSSTDISQFERLAIIQPRGLSPEDNVALDDWVRDGGKLLLVLDPLLTGHYETPIFDPRHPVGSALIPPVVERWGLEMFFDEAQPADLRAIEAQHGLLPVMMAGEFRLRDQGEAQCELSAEGVIAQCRHGKGQIMLVADAALFEAYDPGDEGALLVRSLARAAFE